MNKQNKKNSDLSVEKETEKAEKKWLSRDKKKRQKMKVDSAGVKELQRIIKDKK